MDGPHSPETIRQPLNVTRISRFREPKYACVLPAGGSIEGVSYLYGVAAVQRIQVESTGVVCRDKLGPDVVLWETVIHTQVLNPGRKPLV